VTRSKFILYIVSLTGIAFSAAVILSVTGVQFPQGLTADRPAGSLAYASFEGRADPRTPARIKIPSINVDAAVERVGLTPEGVIDVPKGHTNAAWFESGPRPGENGNSIIDGHFGWKNGIPAVFDELHRLQKGDKLYVEDGTGAVTAFVVREIRTYGENEDAKNVFISNDGKAHLNLVTCEGTWNKDRHSYSDRLVVFTDKEVTKMI